jgi:Flp pilus assembly protein TadB
MHEEDKLNHRDSLGIIEQMIAAARNEHREKGDGWLLWGWLLLGASIASVALIELDLRGYISWVWTGMLVVGLLINFVLQLVCKKDERVTTYAAELLRKLSAGFFISLIVMVAASFLIGRHEPRATGYVFGYFYILYAFWMFIHGSAIRFRPLIFGAVVNWAAALLIFWLHNFYHTMIISSVAILLGYLIPGYMLRRQYKQSVKAR